MTIDSFIENNNINTLVDILHTRANQHPDKRAYTFLTNRGRQEEYLSYGELDSKARILGKMLYERGLQGQRALLLYPPSLEYIVAFFGCLYAGVIAVPIYPPQPTSPISRVLAVAEDSKAAVALTTGPILMLVKQFLSEAPALNRIQWLATDNVTDTTMGWQAPKLSSSTIAFLQYTSGSTSLPKGVIVSHSNLLHNERVIYDGFGHTSGDIVAGWLPLYHDMGLIGTVMQPLYMGSECVLMSPLDFLRSPFMWLEAISKYKVNTTGAPNFGYELCIRKVTEEQIKTLDLSQWRVAFNGAEPIRYATMERFIKKFASCGFQAKTFFPCYGLAESTLFVSGALSHEEFVSYTFNTEALEQNQVVLLEEGEPNGQKLVSSGRLWRDLNVNIVDPETLCECESGQIGEIWIAGPSVAQGYWERPEASAETFQAYITDTNVGPFLRSGDMGFMQDGELFVTGRLKDLIIIDGRNHYPQDIEQTIETCYEGLKPGGSVAFSIDVDNLEQLVVVTTVDHRFLKDKDVDAEMEAIEKAVRKAIADTHNIRVHDVVLLIRKKIPKTSSGKVQRYLCRTMYLEDRLGD